MKNELLNNPFLKEIDKLLAPLGEKCIDINVHKNSSTSYIFNIYLIREDGNEINTDNLDEAYNLIYPFLQVSHSCKNIALEISSPGVERKIKDAYEFSLFVGKNVRIYDQDEDMWVFGTIKKADSTSVTLTNAFNEKDKDISEDITIEFDNIKKSNLLLELKR